MDEVKKGYREGEVDAKKAARGVDGEDLGDKVGNAGDEVRKDPATSATTYRGGRDAGRKVEDAVEH
jgi:hypothetical protein